MMTAFTFRSCWAPHVALGSAFSFPRSASKIAIWEGQQRKWHPDLTPMARAGPSRSIGPLPGGSLGAAWGSLQESNIDDRVRIPVMLGKGLGAGRLRFARDFAL